MAHDQQHTPPARGEDGSPHQDDMRSRHDLDEDRHHRDHYDHHDERRERPQPDDHHRSAPTEREENDRRDDHHHREDHENRRYRHDDHRSDYQEENHHHADRNGADRRENQERHEEPRHHPQDDRNAGDSRGDDRDHPEDRHMRPASNGNSGGPEGRENHDQPHSHPTPPNRQDAPDAADNGTNNAPPPRHDIRPHSPPPHQQQHNPDGPQGDSAAPSADPSILDDDSLVNLFVRNVAKHVQEHQLIDLFSKYGKVDSAVVVRDPHSRECRGFGFVKMTTDKEAQAAIDSLHEFEFEGRHISVERAKRNGPHSRTPGAYMGLDRRIRDRYAGIKRSREYTYAYVGGPYAPPPPAHYPPYRPPPRYHEGARPRHDYRSMHPPPPPPEYHRGPPPMNPRGGYDQRAPGDERDRQRRRYDTDGGAPRYSPRGADPPRDQRVDGRDPPVPRESAEDMI